MLEKSKKIWKAVQYSYREARGICCFLTAIVFVLLQVVSPWTSAFAEEPPYAGDPLYNSVPTTPITDSELDQAESIQQSNDEPRSAVGLFQRTGDLNGDGQVNLDDLAVMIASAQAGLYETGQSATREQGDLNGDQVFDSSDIVFMFQRYGDNLSQEARAAEPAPPVPGDVNGDLKVNLEDLDAISAAGLYETGQPATREQGDLNGDGIADSSDIVLMFQNFGLDLSPPVENEPVMTVTGLAEHYMPGEMVSLTVTAQDPDPTDTVKIILDSDDVFYTVPGDSREYAVDPAAYSFDDGSGAFSWQLPADLNPNYRYFARFVAASTKAEGGHGGTDVELVEISVRASDRPTENAPVILVMGDLNDGYTPGQTVRLTAIATDQDPADTVKMSVARVFYVKPGDSTENPVSPEAYSFNEKTGEFVWQLGGDESLDYRYFVNFVADSTKADGGGSGGSSAVEFEISINATVQPNENYPEIVVTGLSDSYELGQTVRLTVTATDEDAADNVDVGVEKVFYVIPGDTRQIELDPKDYRQAYSVDSETGEYSWQLPAELNPDYRYFVNFRASSVKMPDFGYGGVALKPVEIHLTAQ